MRLEMFFHFDGNYREVVPISDWLILVQENSTYRKFIKLRFQSIGESFARCV